MVASVELENDYNIPSNNRELQRGDTLVIPEYDYNIPSNNRELQLHNRPCGTYLIITYQVITGNYNSSWRRGTGSKIITYQVITGNYNFAILDGTQPKIITYQVITGNYNIPV